MKETISRSLLAKLKQKTPSLFKKAEYQILCNIMAKACGVRTKNVLFMSEEKALESYALFTRQYMEAGIADPEKIYASAYETGRKIAEITGLKSNAEKQELIFYLYRNIEIEMNGHLPGDIRIPVCYFSKIYSKEQCTLMSNADAGIIAGIYGSGRLSFSERLTEGCAMCRASFTQEKSL